MARVRRSGVVVIARVGPAPLFCLGHGCAKAFVASQESVLLSSWEDAARQAGWRLGPDRPDGARRALCPPCGDAAVRRFDAGCELILMDDYLRLLRDHKLPIGTTEMQKRGDAEKRWAELNGQGRNGRAVA